MGERLLLGRWAIAATYSALAAVALASIGLCFFGLARSLLAGRMDADTAAWAQATGSIAALACAVWISGAEGRRDRRLRRQEREELAWALTFALTAARNEAYTIAREVFDPAKAAAEQGRHWKTRCRNARMLLQAYAGRADHVHPAVAQDANNAVILMEELEADLERAITRLAGGQTVSLDVAENLAWYELQLNELIRRIDERMVSVRSALDRGGDMLPIEEFESSPKRQ